GTQRKAQYRAWQVGLSDSAHIPFVDEAIFVEVTVFEVARLDAPRARCVQAVKGYGGALPRRRNAIFGINRRHIALGVEAVEGITKWLIDGFAGTCQPRERWQSLVLE